MQESKFPCTIIVDLVVYSVILLLFGIAYSQHETFESTSYQVHYPFLNKTENRTMANWHYSGVLAPTMGGIVLAMSFPMTFACVEKDTNHFSQPILLKDEIPSKLYRMIIWTCRSLTFLIGVFNIWLVGIGGSNAQDVSFPAYTVFHKWNCPDDWYVSCSFDKGKTTVNIKVPPMASEVKTFLDYATIGLSIGLSVISLHFIFTFFILILVVKSPSSPSSPPPSPPSPPSYQTIDEDDIFY